MYVSPICLRFLFILVGCMLNEYFHYSLLYTLFFCSFCWPVDFKYSPSALLKNSFHLCFWPLFLFSWNVALSSIISLAVILYFPLKHFLIIYRHRYHWFPKIFHSSLQPFWSLSSLTPDMSKPLIHSLLSGKMIHYYSLMLLFDPLTTMILRKS